jgi:hypothetical protein
MLGMLMVEVLVGLTGQTAKGSSAMSVPPGRVVAANPAAVRLCTPGRNPPILVQRGATMCVLEAKRTPGVSAIPKIAQAIGAARTQKSPARGRAGDGLVEPGSGAQFTAGVTGSCLATK